MKKRILLTSVCSILLCFCLITGATFALFTSDSKVNVAVTTGKVDVTAETDNFKVYSGQWNETTGKYDSILQNGLNFATSGNVSIKDNEITISGMVPMDKLTFDINIKNNSNVDVKYQTIFTLKGTQGEVNLLDVLEITVNEPNASLKTVKSGNSVISNWVNLSPKTENEDKTVTTLNVSIYLPELVDNKYQDLTAQFTYCVNATQQNAHTVDPVPEDELDKNTTYIYTVQDLIDLANNVNNGNSYFNKTIKLMSSLDLSNQEWTPIGKSGAPFSGTFDGNHQIISNLKISGNKSDVGLFGFTTNGEIKNLTIKNAEISGYLDVAVVAGNPYTSKFNNIQVIGNVKVDGFSYVGAVGGKNAYANWNNIVVNVNKDSYVKANSISNNAAYRTYVGGVIGFMGEGSHTISNVTSNIDVYGSTCDVGGITGIAHYGNKFINCISTGNVTITNSESESDAKEIGGIAGVWHNNSGYKVTLINCSFKGQLKAFLQDGTEVSIFENNGLVGAAYNSTGTGELVIIDSNNIKTKEELIALNGTGIQAIISKGTVLTLTNTSYLNPVIGAAAIVNNGTLIIESGLFDNGSIASSNGGHVIYNTGKLVINGGEFGVSEESGSAIKNVGGEVIINGGTFASCSRSIDKYGDYTDIVNKPYRYAYVFISEGGSITVNNALVDCNPHGMFSASDGAIITVNGGEYRMEGDGTTYYLVYAYNNSTVELKGGIFEWNVGDTTSPVYTFNGAQLIIDDSCIKEGSNYWINY